MWAAPSSTPCLMICFQLVLLGVARQQRHLHGGLGGAGVARLYGKVYPVLPKAGDGGGVLYGVAVAEDEVSPGFARITRAR